MRVTNLCLAHSTHQGILTFIDAAATLDLQVDIPMHMLMRDLILTLHHQESDPKAVILVFLPTYRALELQHRLLTEMKGANSAAGQAADR